MAQQEDPDPRQIRAGAAIENLIRNARKHFHLFAPLVIRDTENNPISYAPIHLSWIAHVNYAWSHGFDAGIFSHWGSGKSSGFAIPLATWLIGCNPQVRIKIVCANDGNATKRIGHARDIMESRAYRMVFPEIIPDLPWTEHMLTVKRSGHAIDPTLEGRGVFTAGVGGRANYIIFDDACDMNNSTEPKSRDRVKDFVGKVWMGRLEKRGLTDHALWIATPWALDDASAELRASPRWCWLEQRVSEDLNCYEQEASNVGDDYIDFVAESIRMMRGPISQLEAA